MVDTTCGYGTCDRPRENGGLCWMHYNRKRQGKDMDAPKQRVAYKSPLVQQLVEDGASLNEIYRTTGVDYRTIKRHYPQYKTWPVGSSEGQRAQAAFNYIDSRKLDITQGLKGVPRFFRGGLK